MIDMMLYIALVMIVAVLALASLAMGLMIKSILLDLEEQEMEAADHE